MIYSINVCAPYLIIQLQRSLIIPILADVRFSQGGKIKISPVLGIEDHVPLVGRVRKVVVGLVELQLGSVQVVRVALWVLVKDEGELEDAPVEVEDGCDAVANTGAG